MKNRRPLMTTALAGLILGSGTLFTGCESTGGGSTSVSGGVYYGVGFYDPWYYGGYYPPTAIVTPPPSGQRPVRPEQPIAKPPTGPTVSPRAAPSIPSTPMPRSMGGRRR